MWFYHYWLKKNNKSWGFIYREKSRFTHTSFSREDYDSNSGANFFKSSKIMANALHVRQVQKSNLHTIKSWRKSNVKTAIDEEWEGEKSQSKIRNVIVIVHFTIHTNNKEWISHKTKTLIPFRSFVPRRSSKNESFSSQFCCGKFIQLFNTRYLHLKSLLSQKKWLWCSIVGLGSLFSVWQA